MENKTTKKDKNCNKRKTEQEYVEKIEESYKSGIKYYEKVDKE